MRRTVRRSPFLALALASLLAGAGCSRVDLAPAYGAAFAEESSQACRQTVPPDAVVRWVERSDARERASLARWCQTVGPLVLRPIADARSADAIDRLAILTWNVHVGSGKVAEVVQRLRRGDFTGGEPIEHFILLLQEAYRRDTAVPAQIPPGFPAPSRIAARVGRGPDIGQLAQGLALGLFYVPSMRNGIASVDPEDRGNAILSTLVLRDPVVIELPLEHQRRTAAVATVEGRTRAGAPWTLRVANVHFDTALSITRHGPFAARRRQADALVEALGATDAPTVLAGDFNTWWGPTEPAIKTLRRAFPETPQIRNQETWRGPLGLNSQLDYVFIRGSLATPLTSAVQRLPSRFGSDHYPLLAVVRFERPSGGP